LGETFGGLVDLMVRGAMFRKFVFANPCSQISESSAAPRPVEDCEDWQRPRSRSIHFKVNHEER